MRVLNELIEELTERVAREGGYPVLIYEAPTGYGKTVASINFYRVLSKYYMSSGLIHVLPMRSIATEFYCKVVNSVSGDEVSYCKEVSEDPIIGKAIRELRLAKHDIGYQFMDFIDSSKAPYFLKTVLITTFNSFFHNLARFPIAELRKYGRHYEIPRTSIFTSSVVLDEAHLYGGDPGSGDEKTLFTALVVGIKALVEARVPILIESATLPKQFTEAVINMVRATGVNPKVISFRYGVRCGNAVGNTVLECHDDEYVVKCLSLKWFTKVIDDEAISRIVEHHTSVGHRVLVVRNTVGKAVKTYLKIRERLNEDEVEIIHGHFTTKDRTEKLSRCRKAKVVVSTQVIEAGVNISFNTLITDAASPSSIAQRAGRVLRMFEDEDAYVYVVKSDGDGVYDKSVTINFTSKLVEITEKSNYNIDWRIPSNKLIDNRISFLKLINDVYQGLDLEVDSKRYVDFVDIISSPIISQDRLNMIYRKSEGLIYSSILLPVYVGMRPVQTLNELIENSVPLSTNFIRVNLNKILEVDGDGLSVIVLIEGDSDEPSTYIGESKMPLKILEDPVEFLTRSLSGNGQTLIPLAFIARPEVYNKVTGLVV